MADNVKERWAYGRTTRVISHAVIWTAVLTPTLVQAFKRQVPRGPVTIKFVIRQSGHYGYVDLVGTMLSLGSGIAWQLNGDHWYPIMPMKFTETTGITYRQQPAAPIATIVVAKDQIALLSVSGERVGTLPA